MSETFAIRSLSTLEEYSECVQLQEQTWGRGFSERVPVAILKVSQRLGGVVAGAYDADDRLVGFVFGMTGWEDGRAVHWSDMLAVRPELRGTGLGRRLKEFQRECMLAQGVDVIYWTFDPLESRNAYLNISRLGVVVREYARDMYGDTDSPLHKGIGTDRFIARWEIATERVVRRLAGPGPRFTELLDGTERALAVEDADAEMVRPAEPVLGLDARRIAVAVPRDIQGVKAKATDLAVAWRKATRSVFTHYLGRGYEVRELVREGPYSSYTLEGPST